MQLAFSLNIRNKEMDFFSFRMKCPADNAEIATKVEVRAPGKGKGVICRAIWDTGATGSMIAASVAEKLDLKPCGETRIFGVHGSQKAKVYTVDVVFPQADVILPEIRVSEADSGGGFDLLVGMDIIGRGMFGIYGNGESLSVVFGLPLAASSN
jgi:predicted aspartyl protease